MNKNSQPVRVLWFANTPGLCADRLGDKSAGGGWISSLQQVVEGREDCTLGFVFYADLPLDPFEHGRTWYYPVQKIGHTKKKRLLNRLRGRTEYDENLPQFLRAIELFKPDIIHVHGTELSFGLILRRVTNIPVVVSIQGNLTVYGRKYFSGIGMPGLVRRLRSGYPFFKTDYRIWRKREAIEREILGKAKFIFGRTDWDRRISLAFAPRARYFHVDEVIRPGFYALDWQPAQHATPVFLTTSTPSFYKGFEMVIDTARILTGNGVAFSWLVAGLKADHPLIRLIRRLKGAGDLAALNIRLLGTLSEKDLAGYLLQSDAYVQVSHIENSPNSVCEAMLAGIPIIASFAGGTASLLKDGVHGVLVQDGDPYALAGAMVELIRDPVRHQAMAAEARRVAQFRHDPSAIVAGMMDNYSEIIKKHAIRNELKIA